MNASKGWQTGRIASVRQRIISSRRSKKVDLSRTLFADIAETRSKLRALTHLGGPELEHGKKAFGAAHNMRVIGVILLLWALFTLMILTLIIQFGWNWNYPLQSS